MALCTNEQAVDVNDVGIYPASCSGTDSVLGLGFVAVFYFGDDSEIHSGSDSGMDYEADPRFDSGLYLRRDSVLDLEIGFPGGSQTDSEICLATCFGRSSGP